MYSAVDGICDENGLYIKDTNGVSAHVIVPDSSLIVMIGEGGSRMLSPLLGHPLRAVPHKLNLCQGCIFIGQYNKKLVWENVPTSKRCNCKHFGWSSPHEI